MKPCTLQTAFIRGILILASLLLAASHLQAANQAIWTSGDTVNGGTNWSDSANWLSGSLPAAGDDLIINDVTTNANFMLLNDAPHTIGKLQMGVDGTRTNAFTFRSTTNALAGSTTNQLILTNGIFATNNAVLNGPTLVIQTPVTVQGDQTWTVACTPADAGTILIPRGVRLSSSGYGINTTATNTVLTLNGTLIKDGLGMLQFGGGFQQTNGGNIFVKEGTLLLDASSFPRLTLKGGGSITVTNDATLVLGGGFSVYYDVQKQVDMLTGSTLAINVGGGSSQTECLTPVHWNGTNSLVFQSPGGAAVSFNFTNANWTGNSVVTFTNSTLAQPIFLGLKGDNSGFSGKFIYSGGASASTQNLLRFFSNDSGSPNAEWVLNSPNLNNATMEIFPPGTNVQLGALSGPNGTFRSLGTAYGKTVTVGALNTSTTFGGRMSEASAVGFLALVKVGSGTLTLTSDLSTYTGGTVVSNGVVASMSATASAVGNGPVSIMAGAKFSGIGPSSSCAVTNYAGGTLDTPGGTTLSLASLTLGTSSTDVTTSSINVANGGLIDSGSSLTVNGTNIINITGSGTNVGSYDLISYNSIGGAGIFKLGALPPGVTATLDDSGTAVQLNVTAYTSINTTPTNITFTVSGGSLNLAWPSDHQGWHLQCQTNSRATGLGAAWVTIPGSDAITSTNIPINPSNPTVFYRLVYP